MGKTDQDIQSRNQASTKSVKMNPFLFLTVLIVAASGFEKNQTAAAGYKNRRPAILREQLLGVVKGPNLKLAVALNDAVLESCQLKVSTKISTCGGLDSFGGIVDSSNFILFLPPIVNNVNQFTCQIEKISTTCFLSTSDSTVQCMDVQKPKIPTSPNSYFFKIQQSGIDGCALVPDYPH